MHRQGLLVAGGVEDAETDQRDRFVTSGHENHEFFFLLRLTVHFYSLVVQWQFLLCNLFLAFMVNIREGRKEDLPQVLELVKELAAYEKALHQVDNTVAQMERDGFGPKPVFGFFVAEKEDLIVGISLYYYRYSTWKGKRVYLEDIVVKEAERGTGIGKKLFERTMLFTLDAGSSGLVWQVLDWNEPAINFYKKYNASFDHEWVNCGLEADQIREMLGH